MYSFPNDADFAAQKNFNKGDKLDGPAYYRATFDLEETGDVFLDMQTFCKNNTNTIRKYCEIKF